MNRIRSYGQLKNLDERRLARLIMGGIILTSVLSLVINAVSATSLSREMLNWLEAWLLDFSTDLAGGGVVLAALRFFFAQQEPPREQTYFIDATEIPIEAIQEEAARNTAKDTEQRRSDLIREAVVDLKNAPTPEARQVIIDGISEFGLEAINLIDLDLQRMNLTHCNLQNANLTKTILKSANLQGVNLRGANLYMTQLIEANLQNADLSHATLERSYMSGANMRQSRLVAARVGCSLWSVNLEDADLENADLRGAELFRTNLRGANLVGVRLSDAKINRDTILPDGAVWSQQIDITRFTNPDHPDFWRSDDPASPAFYRNETPGQSHQNFR